MKRRVEPTFRALATAGFELADGFFQLHAKGLCYRDISFGNVFFHPETGRVAICDNDNVSVDGAGTSGVLGTPRFMAPEIVRGEAEPSTQTDLFSLSVLLFHIFMVHHPLEGKREAAIVERWSTGTLLVVRQTVAATGKNPHRQQHRNAEPRRSDLPSSR